ncbi:MAG: hypothetical protein GX628_09700 [Clostridiales bacterium]|nr:hypothetical protein [Clostridiales bacterium]
MSVSTNEKNTGGIPSAVLPDINIGADPLSSLIPGLEPLRPQKICFVCTGNTCRSPMAAAVLNHLGSRYGFTGVSAGIYPNVGEPIAENAVKALKAAGIEPSPGNEYTSHTACRVSAELLSGCDKIIGISGSHTLTLLALFPQYASRITAFNEDIADPWGGSEEIYDECLKQITEGIRAMFGLYD